ncbi:hypothetical protein P22_2160 [Propionispora sp. 2/2-37]|uniref:MGDG synthase family glycosyltransferase n=1 Tax=Propionispora sp. 2/2-37 TaxID=1677858 RepID=UPI0006BB7B95|nr:glycosyltransferase [Propionispora sp. 2/2-37]CUH96072.1 hypothetical protein P22_2160 [Propionispora sp. 2/2-37]
MSKHKILFFSAPIGSGHTRAAQAVRTAILRQEPEADVKITNIFDFFSPLLGRFILKAYLAILAVYPPAYGLMYRWGNKDMSASVINHIINQFLAVKMQHYILEYRPSAIVCTHATPAGLAAYLTRHCGMTVPVMAVITDYAVHRLWVYPEIDRYFVAHHSLEKMLEGFGVAKSRIQSVGIPVDTAFTATYDREETVRKLGLRTGVKTLLIMGGGAGVFPMNEILSLCQDIPELLQIIVVTGNNHVVYNKLRKRKLPDSCKLCLLPYVDNVHELMAIADLLVSKPGGMTVSEALCTGLPMLVYKPIPGQEEANTQYLIQHGVAVRADSLEDVKNHLTALLKDSRQLQIMRQNALAMGQPQAAENIAATIFSQLFS